MIDEKKDKDLRIPISKENAEQLRNLQMTINNVKTTMDVINRTILLEKGINEGEYRISSDFSFLQKVELDKESDK